MIQRLKETGKINPELVPNIELLEKESSEEQIEKESSHEQIKEKEQVDDCIQDKINQDEKDSCRQPNLR